MNILTRDQFRESVFERDSHTCVICKNPSQDAHHIVERRLFSDGCPKCGVIFLPHRDIDNWKEIKKENSNGQEI